MNTTGYNPPHKAQWKYRQLYTSFSCNNHVNSITSTFCGVSSTYSRYEYTFLTDNYVCVNGDYKTDGYRFVSAQVCMKPFVNDQDASCTVCIDYYCDITNMQQFDTYLERYCETEGAEIISSNDNGACDGLDSATTFNYTMPRIVWPSYKTQQGRYELQILNVKCDVYPIRTGWNDSRASTAHSIEKFVGGMFVGLALAISYMMFNKKLRTLKNNNTVNSSEPLV